MKPSILNLNPTQAALLKECGFKRQTFVPSYFKKQALNAGRVSDSKDATQDLVSTMVVRGSYQEYFDEVKGEITRELEKVALHPET